MKQVACQQKNNVNSADNIRHPARFCRKKRIKLPLPQILRRTGRYGDATYPPLRVCQLHALGNKVTVPPRHPGMHAQAEIVDEILESARAIRRTLPAQPERITCAALIEIATAIARRTMGSAPLRVELREPPASGSLEIDAARLGRAIAHIIVHAATHGSPAEPVTVASFSSAAGVEITIRRAGAGVDPRDLSDPAWRRRGRGHLSLDMALAREWIEMQDARMLLRADCNGGPPSVVVRLPIRRVKRPMAAPCQYASARQAIPRLDGAHVVLVEDDPDALDFLTLVVTQAGAVPAAFSLAGPAFDFIASTAQSPNVVVSDIAMPVEDGYSFIRRLRHWEATHARIPIPAIAVSAFARDEDVRRAISSGFDRHLAKPVDMARLLHLLASWSSPRH